MRRAAGPARRVDRHRRGRTGPTTGCAIPLAPGQALTPNEKYAALVESAGYVPVPLTADDYIELLPMSLAGDQLLRHQDQPPHLRRRGAEPATAAALRGDAARGPVGGPLRPLRRHPDLGPQPPQPTAAGSRCRGGTASAPVPFGEDAWNHARELVAERGHTSPSEDEIARLVDDLLRRAADGPDEATTSPGKKKRAAARDRRVVAKTAANNTTPTLPDGVLVPVPTPPQHTQTNRPATQQSRPMLPRPMPRRTTRSPRSTWPT